MNIKNFKEQFDLSQTIAINNLKVCTTNQYLPSNTTTMLGQLEHSYIMIHLLCWLLTVNISFESTH